MARKQDALISATMAHDLRKVRRLIASGADINVRDEYGRTPLMNASIDKHLDLAREFLQSGADADLQDNGGYTALHFAAQGHLIQIVELLLSNGAQVDLQDNDGNTPLNIAARYRTANRAPVIKCLVAHGADRFKKNKYEVSARDWIEDSPDAGEVEWE